MTYVFVYFSQKLGQLFHESIVFFSSRKKDFPTKKGKLELSEEDFLASLGPFVDRSDEVGTGWKIVQTLAGKPLSKCLVNKFKRTDCQDELLNLEVHIVYDVSFQVPALLFNCSDAQGRSVLDVKQLLDTLKIPESQLQTSLSQIVHPALGIPFWKVHPCKTSGIIELVQESLGKETDVLKTPGNYLTLWWSIYRKILGL